MRTLGKSALRCPATVLLCALVAPAATPSSDFCPRRLSGHLNAQNPVLVSLGDGTFGALWRDSAPESFALAYARLDGSGAVLAGPVQLTDRMENLTGHTLALGGGRLGVTWMQRQGNANGVYFRLFDVSGAPLSGPRRVDDAADPIGPANPGTVAANSVLRGNLAWDGQGWGIAYHQFVSGPGPGQFAIGVRFAHLSSDALTITSPVIIDDSGGTASDPRWAWNGTDYGVVWYDDGGPTPVLRYRRITRDGAALGPSVMVTPADELAQGYDLVWNGLEYGLAWNDARDGDSGVFFLRLDLQGAALAPLARLSDPGAQSGDVVLRWLDDRWAVAIDDSRDTTEIWLSFASAAGTKLGADVRVSDPADGFFGDFPALAWHGGNLLVLWHGAGAADSMEIHAQGLDQSGNPGARPHRVLTAGHAPGSGTFTNMLDLVATPLGHAVLVIDGRGGMDGGDPRLYLIYQDGAPLGSVAVPDPPVGASFQGGIASSGTTLAVAWAHSETGQVLLSRFTTNGLKLGGDVVLATQVNIGQPVAVAWNGSVFVVAWTDRRDGNQEIYTAAVAENGTVLAPGNRISNDPARSQLATLAPTGTFLAWTDFRGAAPELWGAALDALGARTGAEIALTPNDGVGSVRPHLGANGSALALVWHTDDFQAFFQRLTAAGVLQGQPQQVSIEAGSQARVVWGSDRWLVVYVGAGGLYRVALDGAGTLIATERPIVRTPGGMRRRVAADWDGTRFVVAFTRGVYLDNELHASSLACLTDDTPPSCPSQLSATPSGFDVALSWAPGFDANSGVVWHHLTRNGVRIAGPAGTASSALDRRPPAGPLTYGVTAINHGLTEVTPCPTVTVIVGLFADGFESGDVSRWSATSP